MPSRRIPIAIALAYLTISLGACVSSERQAPAGRITLPPAPADVASCLREAFPEIPARVLTSADVARIIGRAKILDRAKTACGNRALAWIEAVRREFGR